MTRVAHCYARAFTLLEVMIAVAFIGIALLALLALHHTDMQSVIRAQDLTRAAMLAQALMSEAETERFPAPGTTHGNFEQMYPGQYAAFRWQRQVSPSPVFSDIRRVHITVFYGPGFKRSFDVTEFMHNPLAQINIPGVPGNQGGTGSSSTVSPAGAGAAQP